MSPTLHLDSARLGLIAPGARRLSTAFAEFAGDADSLLYFSEFLKKGFAGLPEDVQQRCRGLSPWRGTPGLASSVKRYLGCSAETDVLFASRSSSLMKLAAERLARDCSTVVTVDVLWPPYRKLLQKACRRFGTPFRVCRLRSHLRAKRPSPVWLNELVSHVCPSDGDYGLVLPMVSHHGVALPVRNIQDRLKASHAPHLVVVDAAQAVGHKPVELSSGWCDLLIAGAHKWLGAYHPLGFGVARDASFAAAVPRLLANRSIEDPLLQLSCELAGGLRVRHGETANLAPLLAAQGALDDALARGARNELAGRLRNRRLVARVLRDERWRIDQTADDRRHAILVARPPRRSTAESADILSVMQRHRITATVYADLKVRFAMPTSPLTVRDRHRLAAALSELGAGQR